MFLTLFQRIKILIYDIFVFYFCITFNVRVLPILYPFMAILHALLQIIFLRVYEFIYSIL